MSDKKVEYILGLKDLFSSKIKAATSSTERLNNSVKNVSSSAFNMANALKAAATGYVVNEIVMATASLEGLKNQMNFASGSALQGGKDFEWIREKSYELGLDLQSSAESFAKFSGAARGTSLEGAGVRNVFEGVAMAATTMHLSSEQANGTFTALQQMLSKGKVSAEELNGQLGERLPGALGIAARAMGTTQGALMKMMADGKLMSEDFLPKFANQLKVEFAGGVEAASHSMTANINRLKSTFFELQTTIGESFAPMAVEGLLKAFNFLITKTKEWWGVITEAVSPLVANFYELRDAISGIGESFNWGEILKNALNAVYRILQALKPLISFAIKGFSLILDVVIKAVDAVFSLINYIGDLFGLARIESPIKKVKKPKIETGVASALNTGGAKPTGTTDTKKDKNQSITSVEARQPQVFNIDINKLVEKIEITQNNINDSATAIKEAVTKALIEAVNDFQLMSSK
jgi:tape measure domain-containing protein